MFLNKYISYDLECPQPLPIVAIVSGVAGGVVATGLFLLMLWKILTTIHDRRELAKFEKERLKAKWNQVILNSEFLVGNRFYIIPLIHRHVSSSIKSSRQKSNLKRTY